MLQGKENRPRRQAEQRPAGKRQGEEQRSLAPSHWVETGAQPIT